MRTRLSAIAALAVAAVAFGTMPVAAAQEPHPQLPSYSPLLWIDGSAAGLIDLEVGVPDMPNGNAPLIDIL